MTPLEIIIFVILIAVILGVIIVSSFERVRSSPGEPGQTSLEAGEAVSSPPNARASANDSISTIAIVGWVFNALGILSLGVVFLAKREPQAIQSGADVLNARIVFSILASGSILAGVICLLTNSVIGAIKSTK